MNIFFKVLTDAVGLFNSSKAPALVGEVSCADTEKRDVCDAFEIAAKECFANYGNKFEVTAVRSEEGRSVNYKVYIMFDYLAFLKMHGGKWEVNEKVRNDLLEANKIVADVIARRNGVPIMYGG